MVPPTPRAHSLYLSSWSKGVWFWSLTFSLCSCSLFTRASSWALRRFKASMRASHCATRQASNSTPFSCKTTDKGWKKSQYRKRRILNLWRLKIYRNFQWMRRPTKYIEYSAKSRFYGIYVCWRIACLNSVHPKMRRVLSSFIHFLQ